MPPLGVAAAGMQGASLPDQQSYAPRDGSETSHLIFCSSASVSEAILARSFKSLSASSFLIHNSSSSETFAESSSGDLRDEHPGKNEKKFSTLSYPQISSPRLQISCRCHERGLPERSTLRAPDH